MSSFCVPKDVASNAGSNNAHQALVQWIRNAGTGTFSSAEEVLQMVRGGQ
jgi:hypothetical protein